MKRYQLSLLFFLTVGCAPIGNISDDPKEKSKSDFSECDLSDLSSVIQSENNMAKTAFEVKKIDDTESGYMYYLVANHTNINADAIRNAVCGYISEKKCYLYWSNVANLAMIASKPAPKFPLDVSPHYMLSPYITCDKIAKKAE